MQTKPVKPNASLIKFKYESSLFNVALGESTLMQRFSVTWDGVIYKTLPEKNKAGRRLVQKQRIDTDAVKTLFDTIEACIFDESSQVNEPVDDVGRKLELYYEGEKPMKLFGVYSANRKNTETIIADFIQAYLV